MATNIGQKKAKTRMNAGLRPDQRIKVRSSVWRLAFADPPGAALLHHHAVRHRRFVHRPALCMRRRSERVDDARCSVLFSEDLQEGRRYDSAAGAGPELRIVNPFTSPPQAQGLAVHEAPVPFGAVVKQRRTGRVGKGQPPNTRR